MTILTLETARELVRTRAVIQKISFDGFDAYVSELSRADVHELHAVYLASKGTEEERERIVNNFVACRALRDSDGPDAKAVFDCDEGRALIAELPELVVASIAKNATDMSGIGATRSKKKQSETQSG